MVLYGWIILLTFALSNRSYMEDRYIIYLHVNKINNKVYVGITKHSNPELRWRCGYKNNPYFNYSIKKYGWDGFDHIVLFRNLPKEIACKLEIKLISRYRKKGICYNIANGGEGSIAMSESTKNKLRKYKGTRSSQYGKKHSPERIEQQREVAYRIWRNLSDKERENRLKGVKKYSFKSGKRHPNYNKPLTEEHKNSLRKSIIKTVSCYTLFGKYIKTFKSIREASSYFRIDDGHIGQCCEGKRKTAGGYLWRFGDSINDIPPLRKIIILKENNNIIKEFISIQDAANYVGKHYTCIKNILNGKTKASYSRLNFKYKEAQDG